MPHHVSHHPISSPLLPEAFSGPSNLQFTAQTSDSLRFRWIAAGGPVSGYVVQYTPLSGLGQPITAELRQVGKASLLMGVVLVLDWCDLDSKFEWLIAVLGVSAERHLS